MKYDAKGEQTLMTELWDPALADDLHTFVMFAYPWGKPGSPLEHFKGPRAWQRDILEALTAHIRAQKHRGAIELPYELFKLAVASGRGIGKSALLGWISHWHMTTRIGSTTLISANTEPQLRLTTFPEIKKWFTMAINAHWFDMAALSITPAAWYAEGIKKQLGVDTSYYYVHAKLWSEENPDAYAGPHSQVGMCLIFDEASGIPLSIANVASGYFTDVKNPCRLWLAFSNPRNNAGFFYDCFHARDGEGKRFWNVRQIDSRTVEDVDHAHIDDQIRKYGIDHDVVRVEVLGQFPRAGTRQFISSELVREAQTRPLPPRDDGAPLILGVDIARFGDDNCVARFRKGRDARSIPPVKWQGMDNVQSAEKVAKLIDEHDPDAVFIDQGQGTGVIDILRSKGYRVFEVPFGAKADSHEWANKRTEMYARVRDWLAGGAIDADVLLFGDLTAHDYDFFGKAKDQIILEPKDDVKTKIGRSPDDGDALALTFAGNVARRDRNSSRRRRRGRIAEGVEANQFGEEPSPRVL